MPVIDADSIQSGWQVTGVGTTAGVTVTKAGVAEKRQVGTHLAVSGDAAAVVTLESPASTVLWRMRFAAAFSFAVNLPDETFLGAEGAALLLKISASTANCEATLGGYQRD